MATVGIKGLNGYSYGIENTCNRIHEWTSCNPMCWTNRQTELFKGRLDVGHVLAKHLVQRTTVTLHVSFNCNITTHHQYAGDTKTDWFNSSNVHRPDWSTTHRDWMTLKYGTEMTTTMANLKRQCLSWCQAFCYVSPGLLQLSAGRLMPKAIFGASLQLIRSLGLDATITSLCLVLVNCHWLPVCKRMMFNTAVWCGSAYTVKPRAIWWTSMFQWLW